MRFVTDLVVREGSLVSRRDHVLERADTWYRTNVAVVLEREDFQLGVVKERSRLRMVNHEILGRNRGVAKRK